MNGHEVWHFVLGDGDSSAAPIGQRHVCTTRSLRRLGGGTLNGGLGCSVIDITKSPRKVTESIGVPRSASLSDTNEATWPNYEPNALPSGGFDELPHFVAIFSPSVSDLNPAGHVNSVVPIGTNGFADVFGRQPARQSQIGTPAFETSEQILRSAAPVPPCSPRAKARHQDGRG